MRQAETGKHRQETDADRQRKIQLIPEAESQMDYEWMYYGRVY